jgi:hypothetical protein
MSHYTNPNEHQPSFLPTYDLGDLSDVERDPRMLEFAMRQRKAASAFSARQAQDYVRFAVSLRKELAAKTNNSTAEGCGEEETDR